MDVVYAGFGSIVVDGSRFDHDVVIDGGVVRPRGKGPSRRLRGRYGHTPLSADEEIPWSAAKLIIGTGANGRLPVLDEVLTAASERGVELIAIPTAEACALLRSIDSADVNAILHVTC